MKSTHIFFFKLYFENLLNKSSAWNA